MLAGIAAGDVLAVQGSGQILRIGANGGWMGHVMVALGKPELIQRNSRPGRQLAEIWPADATEVWRVATAESTRSRTGLHQSHMILHLDAFGDLLLVGEETESEVAMVANERVEIWQCPAALRTGFRADIFSAVLRDMLDCQADWSYRTAARAVFQSATIAHREGTEELLDELEASWEAAPICTSVVIACWQRYLQGLAAVTGASDLALILRWMPLKADRGLPGELLTVMRQTGWSKLDLPQSV